MHVSTGYCNPNLRVVEERVYTDFPRHYEITIGDPTDINANKVEPPAPEKEEIPDNTSNYSLEDIEHDHPNVCTYTKLQAERIVMNYNDKIPVCIVRPSIITSSLKEPFEGWIDNSNGITGIIMEVCRGTIRTIKCEEYCLADLIPVDIVSNTLIVAGWANTFNRSEEDVKVYNCTSAQANPQTYCELRSRVLRFARKNPINHVMLYPNFRFTTNKHIHKYSLKLLHDLPAKFFDYILKFRNKEPVNICIAEKNKQALDALEFFIMRTYDFKNDNMKEIIQAVKMTQTDADEFYMDMSKVDWNSYIENYLLGIRLHVLKDNLDSMEEAQRKVKRLVFSLLNEKNILFKPAFLSTHFRLLWSKRIFLLVMLLIVCIFAFYIINFIWN